jgi:WD40 repeat protein
MSRWSGSDFQQPEPLLEIGTTRKTLSSSTSAYRFSNDGRSLAVGSDQGVVQVWDVSRRILSHLWTNTTGVVISSRFIADGNKLIGCCFGDNLVHEWDSTTGQELQSWPQPVGHFDGALACSPDERWCVALAYGGNSLLRNLADQSLRKLDLEVMEAANASYSPDGKLLAVASDLGFVHVFDTATWRREATVGGFFNGAHSVAFSLDGKRLAVGSGGKEAVKLFDTESWQDVLTLDGQGYDYQSLACSPDGNIIGWLSSSGGLHLWRAPSWAEIAAAEAREKAEIKQP